MMRSVGNSMRSAVWVQTSGRILTEEVLTKEVLTEEV